MSAPAVRRSMRIGLSGALVAAGGLLIVGALAPWWDPEALGFWAFQIRGTGTYYVLRDTTLTQHVLGWLLVGIGCTTLSAAIVAVVRPAVASAAAVVLGCAATTVIVAVGWVDPLRLMGYFFEQIGSRFLLAVDVRELLDVEWGLVAATVGAVAVVAAGIVGWAVAVERRRLAYLVAWISLGVALGLGAVALWSWSPADALVHVGG